MEGDGTRLDKAGGDGTEEAIASGLVCAGWGNAGWGQAGCMRPSGAWLIGYTQGNRAGLDGLIQGTSAQGGWGRARWGKITAWGGTRSVNDKAGKGGAAGRGAKRCRADICAREMSFLFFFGLAVIVGGGRGDDVLLVCSFFCSLFVCLQKYRRFRFDCISVGELNYIIF